MLLSTLLVLFYTSITSASTSRSFQRRDGIRGNGFASPGLTLPLRLNARGLNTFERRINTRTSDAILSYSEGGWFNAIVRIGDQEFPLEVDLGSSDTWVALSNFTCYDPTTGDEEDPAVCGAAKTFQGHPPRVANGTHMDIEYAEGSGAVGPWVVEDVTLAGLTAKGVQVSLANAISTNCVDNNTSGVLGLAFPELVQSYRDDTNDSAKDAVAYSNTFVNALFKSNDISHVIGISLQRHVAGTMSGHLTFGGAPPVKISSDFVTTPLVKTNWVDGGPLAYGGYLVVADDVVFPGSENISVKHQSWSDYQGLPGPGKRVPFDIDSGAFLLRLPIEYIEAYVKTLDPPGAYFDNFEGGVGAYAALCNATASELELKFGSETLAVNPADLILQEVPSDQHTGYCVLGVQGPSKDGFSIPQLGITFLRSFVTVLDVDKKQASFAVADY